MNSQTNSQTNKQQETSNVDIQMPPTQTKKRKCAEDPQDLQLDFMDNTNKRYHVDAGDEIIPDMNSQIGENLQPHIECVQQNNTNNVNNDVEDASEDDNSDFFDDEGYPAQNEELIFFAQRDDQQFRNDPSEDDDSGVVKFMEDDDEVAPVNEIVDQNPLPLFNFPFIPHFFHHFDDEEEDGDVLA